MLIAALAATTLVGTITSASAKGGTQPKSRHAYAANPNEAGLIELYSAPEPGQIRPMNWDGSIGGWGPGNFESRH
ncbi:hypothetical protein ACH4ZU_33075 [Streptomyces sp. NPDC020472]|uniref:hypothetical protein n=1 Tax=Streptomyces sp. NPDC020472 TaxID=3365075 RepID=UPI0037A864C7